MSETLPDAHALAAALEPALHSASGGRLGRIEWFRAAWQHGGASTGFATWRPDGQSDACPQAMVKLPVGPVELRWSRLLSPPGDPDPVVPRMLASGDELGGYDLGWIIVERLPGMPLSTKLTAEGLNDLLVSLNDFHVKASAARPIDETPRTYDWEANLARAKEAVKTHKMADATRWLDALRHLHKALPMVAARWNSREINAWCHGDFHPGNALRRAPSPGDTGRGRCVLIDLALVHPGHWIEDALYLERQFWGHSEMLMGVKPLSTLARLRREAGLAVDPNYAEVAVARRVLMAAVVPLFIDREHNTRYVRAALDVLERFLPQVH
jgi:hypothetical protein